jgi:nickel superoxide dismutase
MPGKMIETRVVRMRAVLMNVALCLGMVISPLNVFSHCEIPCGIYDDAMRLAMLEEDIATVEKSMRQIVELSGQKEKNLNQIVRWVNNKEHHANRIQDTVCQYFMTQRVMPVNPKDARGYADYGKKLTLLHEILVCAMKAKQSTDVEIVKKLRSLLESFRAAYPGAPAR